MISGERAGEASGMWFSRHAMPRGKLGAGRGSMCCLHHDRHVARLLSCLQSGFMRRITLRLSALRGLRDFDKTHML